jgi:hypothetical protein
LNDFTLLLGMAEEKVSMFFQNKPQVKYRISYTEDPRSGERKRKKRVIRIKSENGILQILVGYFDLPHYQL